VSRSERDTTRIVRSWLEDGADRIPDRVLDAVEAVLPANPQRRARWLTRMWTRRNPRWVGYSIAAAALVGAAVFGALSFVPPDIGTRPTPNAPTPEPTVLPLDGSELAPGSYTLRGFPARIVFDLPEGFAPCSGSVVEQGICPAGEGNLAPALGFLLVENVVEEPCSDLLRNPPPDSVEDFVTAISSLDGFEATPGVEVSIDGVTGWRFVVTAPSSIGCERLTWSTAQRTNGVGLGEVNELTILEIDSAYVMVSIAHFPTDPPRQSLLALRAIVDSIRISR
jgi:hypothetical protein